jgi:amino acid transporter
MPFEGTAETLPQAGLRRDILGFWHIAAQSVANIAPSATPALVVALIYGITTNGSWLAYVLATLILLLVALNVNQFARRSVSPGSLYTFVAQGLGPTWGVISGWSMVIAYLIIGGSVLAGCANYVTVIAHGLVGPKFDGILTILAMLVAGIGAWFIAYRDVKLSTQLMLAIEFVSIALIMTLSIVYFIKRGAVLDNAQLTLSGVTPANVGHALVLAIFSYVGFESAASLGHEAKNPLQSIPRSILFTVIAVGAYFVFTTYVLVMAFHGQNPPLDQSTAPLNVLANLAGIPFFGLLISIGVAIGFFACALACITAGARVLFTMSRHGLFYAAAGDAHATHATPHIAVTFAAIAVLVGPLALLASHFALLDIFGDLGTLGTLSVLFSYVLVSIAAPVYLHRRGELKPSAVIVSVVAVAAMIVAIVGTIYPVPPPPQSYIPYVFVVLLALGVSRFLYLRSREPQIIRDIEADLITS